MEPHARALAAPALPAGTAAARRAAPRRYAVPHRTRGRATGGTGELAITAAVGAPEDRRKRPALSAGARNPGRRELGVARPASAWRPRDVLLARRPRGIVRPTGTDRGVRGRRPAPAPLEGNPGVRPAARVLRDAHRQNSNDLPRSHY